MGGRACPPPFLPPDRPYLLHESAARTSDRRRLPLKETTYG